MGITKKYTYDYDVEGKGASTMVEDILNDSEAGAGPVMMVVRTFWMGLYKIRKNLPM